MSSRRLGSASRRPPGVAPVPRLSWVRRSGRLGESKRSTEQDAAFESSLITDAARAPDAFLDRAQSRARRRITDTEIPSSKR
jgi:hypothetical protein